VWGTHNPDVHAEGKTYQEVSMGEEGGGGRSL
jgi:hypothetical protein